MSVDTENFKGKHCWSVPRPISIAWRVLPLHLRMQHPEHLRLAWFGNLWSLILWLVYLMHFNRVCSRVNFLTLFGILWERDSAPMGVAPEIVVYCLAIEDNLKSSFYTAFGQSKYFVFWNLRERLCFISFEVEDNLNNFAPFWSIARNFSYAPMGVLLLVESMCRLKSWTHHSNPWMLSLPLTLFVTS